MVKSKAAMTTADLASRLHALESGDVQTSLAKLRKRYGRRATSAAAVRALLDKALGDRALTEELHRSRGA